MYRFDPLAGAAWWGPANLVFRIGVSMCPPDARRTHHDRQLACRLQVRRALASTFLRKRNGRVD